MVDYRYGTESISDPYRTARHYSIVESIALPLGLCKQNNGCRRPQSPAAINELRAILVVLFLIRENLAIVEQTYGV
jgi:hypothetical protein